MESRGGGECKKKKPPKKNRNGGRRGSCFPLGPACEVIVPPEFFFGGEENQQPPSPQGGLPYKQNRWFFPSLFQGEITRIKASMGGGERRDLPLPLEHSRKAMQAEGGIPSPAPFLSLPPSAATHRLGKGFPARGKKPLGLAPGGGGGPAALKNTKPPGPHLPRSSSTHHNPGWKKREKCSSPAPEAALAEFRGKIWLAAPGLKGEETRLPHAWRGQAGKERRNSLSLSPKGSRK